MKKNNIPVISDAEYRILTEGVMDYDSLDWFCDYWFRKTSGDTFRFDGTFKDPAMRWQKKIVFAKQPIIVGMQGIGTGKTLGVGMAAAVWGMTTEGFKFMNGAAVAYQSKLMFDEIQRFVMDTPAERIMEFTEAPYPKIKIRYSYKNVTYMSTLEFMSMDKNAKKIFSWRGDWINLDEAALIDDVDQVISNLATRLTGGTSRGRDFIGRMSMFSNPWGNDSAMTLYYFADLAKEDNKSCVYISIPTSANSAVTESQIATNLLLIRDDDDKQRLLGGKRPEGKGLFFKTETVRACSQKMLNESLKLPGAQYTKSISHGVDFFRLPKVQGRAYMLFGDPGTGAAPMRDAPVIAVFDTTDLPARPATLVGFWWGNGHGKIEPFIHNLYDMRDYYNPIFIGVDSTGPQSGIIQVLNIVEEWSETNPFSQKIGFTPIAGMSFSSGKKPMYLYALKNLIEMGKIIWPDAARGIRTQHTSYDINLDRGHNETKIAQDIVATFSMAAWAIHVFYGFGSRPESPDQIAKRKAQKIASVLTNREKRNPNRSNRSAQSR